MKMMKMEKTPAIMIQGTGSNVGKSILTAALCRIFLEDGYRVVPFKVQNMALNAYVTRDGLEMSRAQALQAQACRIDPDVRMNPILIKPTREDGSQVIVMGKARPVAGWGEYTAMKPGLLPVIREAYDSLASEADLVVLEGAGSPAEINLMENDIVNMKAAEMADAPVLLAGDIDAGGVFAGLVGTLALLPPHQAVRIKGFILNKFRGNREILSPGLLKIREITGRPVLGVVPFLEGLLLPEEDSVSLKAGRTPLLEKRFEGDGKKRCRIVVFDLPKIANFTDLDPFYGEPDVEILFFPVGKKLSSLPFVPDALILPGSKNVVGDLAALRKSGLDEEIIDYAAGGGIVVGLCGGFQMLGEAVLDPHGLENGPGEDSPGLGLLKMKTVLEKEKRLAQVEAVHIQSGETLRGFEMHHGRSSGEPGREIFRDVGGCPGNRLGGSDPTGRVWGSYLHGIFESDRFRRWFIDQIREKKGLPPLKEVQASYDVEKTLARLALSVRKEMDMKAVYGLIGPIGKRG